MAYVIKRETGLSKSQIREYAVTIIEASEKAADLISKLLAFARKGKYQVVAVNVHELIDEVVKLLEHTMDKRIHIEKNFAPGLPSVMGDSAQLQNAVLNLALNARDSMPRNGGTLTFETRMGEITDGYLTEKKHTGQPGLYVVLSVRDTGIGMDPDTIGKIFEPFYTTKQKLRGTGMGLPSVYGTVKSHNGFIEVKSEVGKGSEFILFLPASSEEPSPPKAPEPTEEIRMGKGHILVIDDEEVVRKASQQVLAVLGYQVSAFGETSKAIEFFKDNMNIIDLVVLDLVMPEMSGYDCFTTLRSIKNDIKVLVTSGYTLDKETRKILDSGAIGFIQKPFDIKRMSEMVFAAINQA
jgi:CheY-like chemotaxis protein